MTADLRRWQARMAPFLVASVVSTGLFFAVATIWKFGDIEARLTSSSVRTPEPAWNIPVSALGFNDQMRLEGNRASYNLERELIARRYEQANLAFVSRLWTRFMGFVTGMVLGLVGAAFVLGKLETDTSEVGGTAYSTSLAIRSTSPGLVLAVLGTVLMALSIALPVTITVKDGAIYFPVRSADSYEEASPKASAASPSAPEPPLRASR